MCEGGIGCSLLHAASVVLAAAVAVQERWQWCASRVPAAGAAAHVIKGSVVSECRGVGLLLQGVQRHRGRTGRQASGRGTQQWACRARDLLVSSWINDARQWGNSIVRWAAAAEGSMPLCLLLTPPPAHKHRARHVQCLQMPSPTCHLHMPHFLPSPPLLHTLHALYCRYWTADPSYAQKFPLYISVDGDDQRTLLLASALHQAAGVQIITRRCEGRRLVG